MKLVSLQATNRQTKQRQFFKFDVPTSQKRVVTSNVSALNNYLQFCFDPAQTGDFDVTLCFQVGDQSYRLEKLWDGQNYQIQLFATFVHSQTLIESGIKALAYVQAQFDVDFSTNSHGALVDDNVISNFNGDLSAFDNVYQLQQAYMQMEAPQIAPQTAQEVATEQDLQASSDQLLQVEAQLFETRSQLAALKGAFSSNAVVSEVVSQLALLKTEQDKLNANTPLVESMRQQLQIRDEVVTVVPKIAELEALSQQKAQYQAEYDQALEQLNWQETEFQSISEQLAQKQSQTEVALDRYAKIQLINQEIQTISTLREENKQIAEQLDKLGEQNALLLADKEIFTNKLISIENEIEKCQQTLEQLQAPEKSVSDLLEGVKIDTKLEEISAQIEIIQTELALKDNQLAEKESNLVVQTKRFRSVAELDVTVSPIKAKDTILQVLESKYGKLEQINQTLAEKLRNLQRAVEDYRYRITQLDSSKNKLQSELEITQAKKREEFKREVYLNAQRTFADANSIYAVTTRLDDVETETLRQDLLKRNADRDFLVQKASQLEGRIAEIKRHIAINDAEMQSLRAEKGNINDHYNQIVAQNRGEAVFNYLKALESNNGTRYLLDIQQDAVKSQAEIGEIKRSADTLRGKLQSLQERQARLLETRSHLSQVGESTVSTNQQLKDDLSLVADSLSSHYSLYQSLRRQLDKTETDLAQINAQTVQLNKQLQVNQTQIEKSTQRATEQAGTTNLEQAVSDFKYQVADVGDEEQMLQEAFSLAQKELFKRRVQVEKLQWLLQGVTTDFDACNNFVTTQLNQRGLDASNLNLGAINKHADQMRQTIAKYDSKHHEIATKMAHLQSLIKDETLVDDGSTQSQIETLTATEQALLSQKQSLEQLRAEQLQSLFVGAQTQPVAQGSQSKAVCRLLKNSLSRFVSNAQSILTTLLPNYSLQLMDGTVQVYKDGVMQSYMQMPAKVKTAVYLSLLLSSWQDEKGRWLLLDIKGATKDELTQLLATTNTQYVVAYTVINKEKQS